MIVVERQEHLLADTLPELHDLFEYEAYELESDDLVKPTRCGSPDVVSEFKDKHGARRESSTKKSNSKSSQKSVRFTEADAETREVPSCGEMPLHEKNTMFWSGEELKQIKASARSVASTVDPKTELFVRLKLQRGYKCAHGGECVRAEAFLTAWCLGSGRTCMRGLERSVCRRHKTDREQHRYSMVQSVLDEQERQRLRGLAVQESSLAKVSKSFSSRSSNFALMMGMGDAAAARQIHASNGKSSVA